ADVIVLETGANDGLRGLSVRAARENIQAILDHIRARRPAARVLLVQMEAPPNLGEAYTRSFRAMYPELAKQNGVELVPFLLEGVAGVPALNQDDGIHPNRAGARIVARTVYAALVKHPLLTTATTERSASR
ncbi:MAG TPA: GDSL-type esterase/lipase family protein, partial [Gemmatimonadaceae bacterium]|nr:GDSL-type esterase/lipase family protein [Gemmatimonadaceae bacterium]